MLYGAPSDDVELQILRVDGAGPKECNYTDGDLSTFDAELAAYNAAAACFPTRKEETFTVVAQ